MKKHLGIMRINSVFLYCVLVAFQGTALRSHAQLADDFEDAGDLGSNDWFQINQGIEGGTVQLGESPNEAPGWESYWGEWTAPEDGLYLLRNTGSDGIAAAVYEGESMSNLQLIAAGRDAIVVGAPQGQVGAALFRFHAKAETTYPMSFALRDYHTPGLLSVSLEKMDIPENDNIETPIDLGSALPVVLHGNGLQATTDPLEEKLEAPNALWWEWTAPEGGAYRLRTTAGVGTYFLVGSAVEDPNSFTPNLTPGFLELEAGERLLIGCSFEDDFYRLGESWAEITPVEPFDEGTNTSQELATNLGTSGEVLSPRIAMGESGIYDSIGWWRWTPNFSGAAVLQIDDLRDNEALRYLSARMHRNGSSESLRRINYGGTQEFYFEVVAGEEVTLEINFIRGSRQVLQFRIEEIPVPDNDDFSNPQDLGETDFVEEIGYYAAATFEDEEPNTNSNRFVGSVWWTWTAPSTREYSVWTSSQGISVFTGEELSNLEQVATGFNLQFEATAGTTYRISTSGERRRAGRLIISPVVTPLDIPPPFNNSPATAIDLGSPGSTLLIGNPPGDGEAWWKWSPPVTGVAHLVFTAPRSSSLFFSVFAGDPTAGGIQLSDTMTRHTFFAQLGTEYFISATSDSPEDVRARIQMLTTEFPQNLEFESAQTVSGDLPFATTSHFLTEQVPQLGSELWWTWDVPETGFYDLEILHGGGVPKVFLDDALGLLERELFSYPWIGEPSYFFAEAGEQLAIAVELRSAFGGFFGLTLDCSDLLPFGNGRALAINLGNPEYTTYRSSTALASETPDGNATAWFRWTSPGTGTVSARNIEYLSGVRVNLLRIINGLPADTPSEEELSVVPGQEIYITAYNRFSSRQVFDLEVEFIPTGLSAYDNWLQRNEEFLDGQIDPNQDPDRDNIPNILEMVFGTQPEVPQRRDSTRNRYPHIVKMPNGEQNLVFRISPDVADGIDRIAVDLEFSRDLQEWQATPLEPGFFSIPLGEEGTMGWYRFRTTSGLVR